MAVTVEPRTPAALTLQYAVRTSVNPTTDLGVGWDGDYNPPQMFGFPAKWLFDFGSTKIKNVVTDYGADPTGAASSVSAFSSAVTALSTGDVLLIPPGTYNLTGASAMDLTGNQKSILGVGMPKLDFGGTGYGFRFNQTAAMEDWHIRGLWFYNFLGGVFTGASAQAYALQNSSFRDLKFTDSTGTIAEDRHCLSVMRQCKNVLVDNVYVDNISAANNGVIGIRIGYKDTSDPTVWGYTGGPTSAWAGLAVRNCYVRRLTGKVQSAGGVYGIQVDGWRMSIRDNTVETINQVDAASYRESTNTCGGMVIRGYDGVISGNHFLDAGRVSHLTVIGAHPYQAGNAYGSPGRMLIHDNDFQTQSISVNTSALQVTGSVASIVHHNKFYHIRPITGISNLAVVAMSNYINGMVLENNIFDHCWMEYHGFLYGPNAKVRGNKIFNSCGRLHIDQNQSSVGFFVASSTVDSAGIVVEDNDIELSPDEFFSTGGVTTGVVISATYDNHRINGLTVRNNRMYAAGAIAGLSMSSSNIQVVNILPGTTSGGYTDFDITDNWCDHSSVQNVAQISDTNRANVSRVLIKSKFLAPVVVTASGTINKGLSGVMYSNNGATSVVTQTLPPAYVGLTFGFTRINATYAFRIAPNSGGPDTIGEGAAGQTLEMQSRGEIWFQCRVAGRWEIISDSCLYDYV